MRKNISHEEGHLAALGAMLVVGPQNSTPRHASCDRPGSELSPDADQAVLVEGSLACVEILGRSVLQRTVERLCRMGVQIISVLMDEASSNLHSAFCRPLDNATLHITDEPWAAAVQKLSEYAARGIETAFAAELGGYVEIDAEEMLQFHRQERQASTRASTELKRLMLNGELRNTLRLSLLPCLATAAALEFKITGSDKGIW